MYWRTLSTVLFLTLLAGCAASPASPPVANDHPASPTATPTPSPARSTLLAINSSADAPNAVPEHAVDHAAHAHGAAAAPATQPGQTAYVCPMHPEVVSAKADDRCPKCKMKLKLKPATQSAAPTPATVPTTSPAGHQHGGH